MPSDSFVQVKNNDVSSNTEYYAQQVFEILYTKGLGEKHCIRTTLVNV